VPLRRALLDLGIGLWHQEPAARDYAGRLRERGKPGQVIACALAHRANKIAYAMVRDQKPYDPGRWPDNHERWWHAERHGRPDQTPFRL
jgi:hypothetical protein